MEILQFEPFARGIMASSMVGILCGLLGPFIVLRNMSMIGDALSHAILPGIVVAFVFFGYHTFGFFVGAVIAGMLTSLMITWVQQHLPTKNDAAIGIIFSSMFAIGVLGISYLSQHEGAHLDLKDFLFGSILAVSPSDLWMTAFTTVVVAIFISIYYRPLFISTFQPTIAKAMGVNTNFIHYLLMMMLSFAVVASLNTVGVILVVALLITPTSIALLWVNRLPQVLLLSSVIGLISACTGMFLAIQYDMVPGPVMTLVVTAIYFVSAFIAPEHGLISKRLQQFNFQNKIWMEDILKAVVKIPNNQVQKKSLRAKLEIPSIRYTYLINGMQNRHLIKVQDQQISLTDEGKDRATQLVRAHRLWETYLVSEHGLTEGQIHPDAERMEHILTAQNLDEVDAKLDYPDIDPHGKLIPKNSNLPFDQLKNVKPPVHILIASHQHDPGAIEYMWENEITPGEQLIINHIDEAQAEIEGDNGTKLDVPLQLLNRIEFTVK